MTHSRVIHPVPLPRGVADEGGRTGFFRDSAGRILAVDLATGSRRWTSEVSGHPMLAAEGRLVACASMPGASDLVQLVTLDGGDGSLAQRCTVQLPLGIDASTPRGELTLRVVFDGDSVVLEWEARSRYRGGAPPPPFAVAVARGEGWGRVRCDFAGGRSESISPRGEAWEHPRARPPSWPYRMEGVWREEAWALEDWIVSLHLDESEGEPLLELRVTSRSTERREAPVRLGEGCAFEPTLTPDGRYLFLRRTAPGHEPWVVLELPSGEAAGAIPWEPGSQLPCVVGGRAFHLVGHPQNGAIGVRAVELASAEVLWELDLGNPAARQVPPPLPR